MVFITISFALLSAFLLWQVWRLSCRLEKQAEDLQRAMKPESLGTLAGGIAHDFNNILGAVLGFGVLLEEDLTPAPEQQEMAKQITKAARRGQEIVAQLMNYSRQGVTADKDIQLPVSLDALIQESIGLLQPCIRPSTKINYTRSAGSDIVLANSTQIGQVIVNLCINADHAIGVKTGEISITLDTIDCPATEGSERLLVIGGDGPNAATRLVNGRLSKGSYARLRVRDNGDGMEKAVAMRIFEPFFTTKNVGIGTGLGLAAIQGIIHNHNGAIHVSTQKFRGTTFDIMLPLPSTDE